MSDRKGRGLAGLQVCVVLLGCGSTKLTPVGVSQRPRAENCDFQVFAHPPARGYVEVGIIDAELSTSDVAAFRRRIQPYVCRGGGDAAIAITNGHGVYIKASVLKAVVPTTPADTARQVTEAPPYRPTTPAEAGCHYDTQCKGSRLCVRGECEDAPSAAPASPSKALAAPMAP